MSCVYHGRTKGEGKKNTYYIPFQGGASAMVYYFCHCMSSHVCPGDFFFILISCLSNL